jgi:hypothetical protein
MTRRFRGATYQIEIDKPEGICQGAVRMEFRDPDMMSVFA